MDNREFRRSLAAISCICLLGLASCETMKAGTAPGTSETGGEKESTAHYRFSDVPVPASFKLDREKSFVYETGSSAVKIGRLFYTGMSRVDDLVAFYQGEMVNNGWSLVRIIEQSNTIMLYEKKGWVCTVYITGGTFRSTIEIQLGPR